MYSAVLQVAAETQRNPLLPETFDIFWSAVVLVVVALVLGKFALPAFNKMVDERTRKIQEGLTLAEKAKQQVAQADEQAQSELREARKEAQEIRDKARADGKDIVARAREEAKQEAERARTAATREIEAERQSAQLSLRSDVGLLAAQLAEKIVGEQLKDRELSARVIDRFLDDLEASPAPEGAESK